MEGLFALIGLFVGISKLKEWLKYKAKMERTRPPKPGFAELSIGGQIASIPFLIAVMFGMFWVWISLRNIGMDLEDDQERWITHKPPAIHNSALWDALICTMISLALPAAIGLVWVIVMYTFSQQEKVSMAISPSLKPALLEPANGGLWDVELDGGTLKASKTVQDHSGTILASNTLISKRNSK